MLFFYSHMFYDLFTNVFVSFIWELDNIPKDVLEFECFTRTTGRRDVTKLVAQRTCNIKKYRKEKVIPQQPSISIKHPCLSNNFGNATQPLAPIFLLNVLRRQTENIPVFTQITRESVYQAIRILNDDDFLKLDIAEKQDLVYNILEDEARLDLKASADVEKNSDENKGQNLLKIEDKIILAKPTGPRQVRVNINTQIIIISVNGCEYFKCNTCPQQYKWSVSTKDTYNHIFCIWLEYVNSASNPLLLNSKSTIWARIISLYKERQCRIYLILQDALFSIHISYDD